MSLRWITIPAVLAIHEEQIAEHGGSHGVRDMGLLESALAKPRNLAAYGEPDLAALAAAYAAGIAKNHPFIDGNKRTAFVVAATLLDLNGVEIHAREGDVVETIVRLAAGQLTELELAEWFRRNSF